MPLPESLILGKDGGYEYMLVNPHGDHSSCDERGPIADDGLVSVRETSLATLRKGVLPIKTSHNTLAGSTDVQEVLRDNRLDQLACIGVELSFHIETFDLIKTARIAQSIDSGLAVMHAGIERLSRGVTPREHSHELSLDDINTTRNRLVGIAITTLGKTVEEIHAKLEHIKRSSLPGLGVQDFVLDSQDPHQTLKKLALMYAVEYRQAFAFYYANARITLLEELFAGEEDKFEERISKIPERELIEYFAILFHQQVIENRQTSTRANKGELIVLLPHSKDNHKKLGKTVFEWRKNNFHTRAPLMFLLEHLNKYLGDPLYDQSAKIVPHPFSVDSINIFGKLLLRLLEGDVSLYSPELTMQSVAAEIDGLEVLNGAHPKDSNLSGSRFSTIDLFSKKTTTAGADNHHPAFAGAAATLIAIEERTAAGVINALKKGPTIPVSGLGKMSLSWLPFFIWGLTVPVKGKNFTPPFIFDKISTMIHPRRVAEFALSSGIVNGMNRLPGWVYEDKGVARIAQNDEVFNYNRNP